MVQQTESLKRISFLAHSLGGLFARYAIAVLYNNSDSLSSSIPNDPCSSSKKGVVAGLEPISFITLATPHLGVRGKKQVGFLEYYWLSSETLNNCSLIYNSVLDWH